MLVKSISQKDRYSFTIEWHDGLISEYRLSQLQKHCPCITCREKRFSNEPIKVHQNVMALRVANVGRYALRVNFTSGCSNGIYSFALLRRIK